MSCCQRFEVKTLCHETFPVMVTIPEYKFTTKSKSGTIPAYKKICPIDMCIAPIVNALEDHGIYMSGSCCGHGKWDGEIILQDGRKLIIKDLR